MADTAAALVIQLSADVKQFRKEMRDATGVFDKEGRKIERRQELLKRRLSNFAGMAGMRRGLVGLTAVGLVGGAGAAVNKALDIASSIGEIAIQAGVSTKRLQELRFASAQTGGSFDLMDGALT